jgi:hypothetical protein
MRREGISDDEMVLDDAAGDGNDDDKTVII